MLTACFLICWSSAFAPSEAEPAHQFIAETTASAPSWACIFPDSDFYGREFFLPEACEETEREEEDSGSSKSSLLALPTPAILGPSHASCAPGDARRLGRCAQTSARILPLRC